MGVIEKLPYLKRLGINAIELLPVHEFNELEYYAVGQTPPPPCSNSREHKTWSVRILT